MKKTISLLLVAVLLVAVMAPVAFAAEHTGTVTVTYTASGDPFTGFQGYLTYDHEVFELVSVTGLSDGDFIATESIDFAMWAVTNNVTGPISVMSAEFKIIKPDAECKTYTFGFSFEDTSNELLETVSISVVGNSITLEHDWVAGEEVKATCTTDGYIPYTCSICGATKQETTTKAGHTPAEAVKENVVNADCVTAGSYDSVVYCSVCGEELSRDTIIVDATGHDHVLTDSTTGADCKTPGKDTYTCSCGDSYTVDNDKYGDHSYKYAYDENEHWMVCEKCGDTTEKHPHKFVPQGNGTDKCECGATRPTPTEDDDDNKDDSIKDDTGDITPYPVFIMMAIAAVMGTAYGFKRKFDI